MDDAPKMPEVVRLDNIVMGRKIDVVHVEVVHRLRREMTPEERLLWNQLRGNRLHGLHFRRQQLIDGFIVDFYCHAARLVVEIDGGIHDEQVEYDAERDRVLSHHGLTVLRFTNSQVRTRLSDVLDLITTRALARSSDANADKSRQTEHQPPTRLPFPTREGAGG